MSWRREHVEKAERHASCFPPLKYFGHTAAANDGERDEPSQGIDEGDRPTAEQRVG